MPQRLQPFSYPKHTDAISALKTKLFLSTDSAMHCSVRVLYHNLTPIKQPLAPCARISPSSGSNPNPNPILRRDFASSSLLLLLITPNTNPLRAETISPNCADPAPTKQAFIDVSVDGEAIGRIIIGLYSDSVPAGAARFGDIVSGAGGVSYRRKEFVKIMPNYVQHAGLRSYGADAELARKTGREVAVDRLVEEWEKQNENCTGTKNVARSVSIIVRDPSKPPPKLKLVARKGKLEIDQEEVGMDPNGTEFVIATKDSPELDGSALVVGTVLQGMDVVDRISRVKTVQENSTSPYFRVAKLIGDKRAVVAERGFNRPYSKVVITNCGLIG
ncbi:peptidyl-prolyl cis-trans isomerase CYP26-2, chloroplastic [Sesamum indicum]|uniref:Peptidyl-prolyl cis-trans isomerase CYP26-2, chloroplastic n=1 Tax=Sesamum indicum TaxID=4182 RepID=A0A6I9SRB3_SESIN|nr:peptidyl-prolyl cis-trans isomerase CYP26-2, chloroplastic [Sesamum indicum]XP_020548293.1 peptidyl-prolyl cis-trans isomerase CYP26-2, chloroplastic [Sesamum indicum]